jgi:hypothetical protein
MTTPRWITISVLLSGVVACGASPDESLGDTSSASSTSDVRQPDTIAYSPNSFVIGNAYPGWTDELHGGAVFRSGPGNPGGTNYQCGMLFGEAFDHCGWIDRGKVSGGADGNACGSACPAGYDTTLFRDTYTDGTINSGVSDGQETHMHYAGSGCSDTKGYGNVSPWRVPATPANAVGSVPDGKLLLWRYVSKDGHWVLVRDPAPPSGQPNWYFVHRGCVSLAPPSSQPPPPPPPPPPPSCGTLSPGQELGVNESVTSCGGGYTFIMQGDGNLVLYAQGGHALWDTKTNGRGGNRGVMQGDGNLVVYSTSNEPLWASKTNGHPGAHLAVQDDSNIVVYDGSTPLWARFGL